AAGRGPARSRGMSASGNGVARVAVTGLGAITPLGHDAASSWDSCRNGRSGIAPITLFDATPMPTRIGGEVKGFDGEAVVGKKEVRRTSRCSQLAIAAAREAVTDSGLEIAPIAEDVGVLVASGIGGLEILERGILALHNGGPRRVSPFMCPSMIADMP